MHQGQILKHTILFLPMLFSEILGAHFTYDTLLFHTYTMQLVRKFT